MSSSRLRKLVNRKRRIHYRLCERPRALQEHPMFTAGNIHHALADRVRALGPGRIGAVHRLARRVGLIAALDRRLRLLKVHLPYRNTSPVCKVL